MVESTKLEISYAGNHSLDFQDEDIVRIENLPPHQNSLNNLFYKFYEFLYHDL